MRASILQQTLNEDGSYSTFTDATGRYSFTGIPVGNYTLIAARDQSHQFAKTNVILGAVTQQDAQLTPTGSVTGRIQMIVDAATENIPGAIVYLDGTSYVAVSGLDGTYTISNVPANQSFTVKVVTSKGAATTSPTVTVTPGTSFSVPTILLAAPNVPTSIVSGQIAISGVSAPDAELAGHMILLTSQDQAPLINLTDENGNYSFIVRAGGDYRITPIPEEYDSIPLFQAVNVTLGQNTSPSQTFTLQADQQGQVLFLVEGSLTKTEKAFNEADEAGVPITLTETGSQRTYATISIPDGSFNFEVPAGEYELAIGGGYALEAPLTTNPFTVSAFYSIPAFNIVPTRNVVLVQGTILKTSKVMGETDEAGVALILTSADSVTYPSVTDAAGNFSFFVPNGTYELSTGGVYQFENHPFGGSPLVVPLSAAQQTVLASPINVVPMGVGQQIALVQGQISKVAKAFGETDEGGVTLTLTTTDATAITYSAVSAPDGSFSFSVPLGEYSFAVSGSYKLVTDPLSGSPLNVTGDYYFSTIEVGPHQEMVQVQGSVAKQAYAFDETGDHSGVNITLSATDASGNVYSAISDVNGYFSFNIPSGTYELSIGGNYKLQTAPHPDVVTNDPVTYISTPISVIPSAELFNVVGIISKTATVPQDPSGTNPVTVILRSADNSYEAITSDNGDFAFKVKAGAYNIELSGPYVFDTAPAALLINADEDYGVLNVSPSTQLSAVLAGTIILPPPYILVGDPVEARLWDEDNSKYVAQQVTVKISGGYSYRFDSIPPGNYRVLSFPDKNGFFAETPVGSPVSLLPGDSFLNHDLVSVKKRPQLDVVNPAAGNLIDLLGSDFTESPIDPASTTVLVDGKPLPRPLASNLTPTSDRADVSALSPGEYEIQVTRVWDYLLPNGLNESFTLRSNPSTLVKPVQAPTSLTQVELTDRRVKYTWNNAPGAQSSQVRILDGATEVVNVETTETFFEYDSLTQSTAYTIEVVNKAGSLVSAPVSEAFTTKLTSETQIQVIPLSGSSSYASMGVFDFVAADGNFYFAYGSSSIINIAKYDSAGNFLSTLPANLPTSMPMSNNVSLAYGNNLLYIAYPLANGVQVDAIDPETMTVQYSNTEIAGSFVQIQMICAAGKVFVAYSTQNAVSPYNNSYGLSFFDNPTSTNLGGISTLVGDTSINQDVGYNYATMVCADDTNLYYIEPFTNMSSNDTFRISRYNLANPTPAPITVAEVPSNVNNYGISVKQFKFGAGKIFLRTWADHSDSQYNFVFIVDPITGIAEGKSGYIEAFPFASRGDFGADSKGRIWMGEIDPAGQGRFVQTNFSGASIQFKPAFSLVEIEGMGASAFPNPAKFIKVDPSNQNMNMLFFQNNYDLAVYRYTTDY